MILLKKSLFIFYTFLIYNFASAQYQITKDIKDKELIIACIDSIYNNRFEIAEKMYLELRTKFPQDPSSYMLQQLSLYWQLVPLTVHNEKFIAYSNAIKKTIELSMPLLNDKKTEAEATFYLMASYSSLIIVQIKMKEFGKALGSAKQTYHYMKKGFVLKKNYSDFHYSTGLFNYYVEQYPDNHPVVKPIMWMFPKGDKITAIKEFTLGAENGLFSKPQSMFFLVHVNIKYENKPEIAHIWADKLLKIYPNNPLVLMYNAEICLMQNDFEKTMYYAQILSTIKKNYPLMTSEYFKGMVELKKNNNTKLAKAHFYYALKICAENQYTMSDFLGLIHLGLGLCYEKEKNKVNTEENFKKANSLVEHRWAKNELERYYSVKKSKR